MSHWSELLDRNRCTVEFKTATCGLVGQRVYIITKASFLGGPSGEKRQLELAWRTSLMIALEV